MKKLLNSVESYVEDLLEGIAAAHPHVRRVQGWNVIVRRETASKVALISGGGSGHEPAHAGFVGTGMLDAAVAGEVFTSPTPDQVLTAIHEVNSGHGVLLIIKNYTGDIMNFEMAAELARSEGIEVEQVVVADDVAVENSTYTVGRRGIAGTVFVHKIAGAAAEAGKSLREVQQIANRVIENAFSMGIALTPCTVPASGRPSFELAEDEIEIGLGIHGEPGTARVKLPTAASAADILVERIQANAHLKSGDRVAVLMNGLGGTPLSEMYIVYRHIALLLTELDVQVCKTYVGEYMTSLDMAGCSLSILRLDDELESLLDAPCEVAAF